MKMGIVPRIQSAIAFKIECMYVGIRTCNKSQYEYWKIDKSKILTQIVAIAMTICFHIAKTLPEKSDRNTLKDDENCVSSGVDSHDKQRHTDDPDMNLVQG